MELNSLLFPAPIANYGPENLEGEAIYLPRFFRFNKETRRELEKDFLIQKQLAQKRLAKA